MNTVNSHFKISFLEDAKNKSFAFKRAVPYHQKTCFNSVLKQVFYRQTANQQKHLIYRIIIKQINSFSRSFTDILYRKIITILTSRTHSIPKCHLLTKKS
ncbi:hypothetical protein F9000_18625 [Bacteroides fragilis]|uniref:Uncharacterized protein n=1 Tax=Bacteroides fragilis TaxID=817 RepID=A0A5C6L494_BACFG|nr:hypothetical protein F9000_18625 [Bacteroides fragilis]KAB5427743.1 hypothetical protein F9Z99_18995 [Bacteroides fragilis]RGL71777.1 hypothetical protein DXC49_17495 [Bacteroides fragilis]RHI14944.1 hypothetical protein DW176_20395 [Bacteroides fragilis]RHI27477.1 hypothetical protein DW170_20645 [Bacteroides fragilis]